MIKRLLMVLIGCTLVFGGVFGFKYMGKKGMEQYFNNMPSPPATISATEAKLSDWADIIEAAGTLTAVNGIEVTTEASGIVKSIHFESGDQVKKGEVLLRLDADTDVADLRTLEAQAKLAQTELERIHKLHELDSVSKADLDRAESEAAQARARVQAQRARIAQKIIRAPFAGQLGIRKVDLGEYVSPGTPIVSLQALDPLYVDFTLPEQRINRIQAGLKTTIEVDLYPGEIFDGNIQAVDAKVNQETRNFSVRAVVPNTTGLLRPGVFARVKIVMPGTEEVVTVPRTSINYNAYGNSVFVISEEKAEAGTEGEEQPPRLVARQRFVKTGAARGDFVVIEEGLKPGEQVATSGLLKLRNNQPVIINNELQPDTQLNPAPADT